MGGSDYVGASFYHPEEPRIGAGVPQLAGAGDQHREHHSELVLRGGALHAHPQLPLPHRGRRHSTLK